MAEDTGIGLRFLGKLVNWGDEVIHVSVDSSRARRRAACLAAAAGVAFAAAGVFGGLSGMSVHAQTPLGSAEGDSFLAQGVVHLLGSNTPVVVGPLTPTAAYVPGGPSSTSAAIAACTACLGNVVDRVQAGLDTASATLTTATTTNCIPNAPAPPGITNGPFQGGNACSNLAGVGLLGPTPLTDLITADAVNVQALTTSCDSAPTGFTNIAHLTVSGLAITVPQILKPNTSLTTLAPALAPVFQALGLQVILNEQHYDNHGHGITVNAIHVILNGALNGVVAADVIVGHAHSAAACAGGGTTDTGSGNQCPPASVGTCSIPVITKTDSVSSVAPGGTVTYTISIAQQSGCPITRITDTLPAGFSPAGSSGDFGTAVSGTVAGTGQATLTWTNVNGVGGSKNPITETLTASVDSKLGSGLYINAVDLLSAMCGEGHGQDNGITVTSNVSGSAGAAATSPNAGLINTAGATGPGGDATGAVLLVGGGLLGIAAVSYLARRRRQSAS